MSDSEDKVLHCSFCGKSQNEVKKLIAGRGVYICDECIDVCINIVSNQSGKVFRLVASTADLPYLFSIAMRPASSQKLNFVY